MSAKARNNLIWSLPVVVMASWLAVRALGASAAPSLAVADSEIADSSLRAMIGRFADAARARSSRSTP
jgi:hypothetical protein